MSFYKKFFGIADMPIDAQRLIKRIIITMVSYRFLIGLGNSFIILAFIDNFGFGTAGFFMAVAFTSQFLTDYPTGSLADYIGQKWVIALSLIFSSAGYFLISFYVNFIYYFFASICIGIGLGQLSGSFESYLDNNYKKVMKERDQERKLYGFMFQRVGIVGAVSMGIAFIIGGLISNLYTRDFLFKIQGLLLVLLVPIVIYLLNDINSEDDSNDLVVKNNLFTNMKGGLSFLFSSKSIFFLLFGLSLYSTAVGIWGALILFPLYNAYTGSDAGVGTLRAIIFFIAFFVVIYIPNMILFFLMILTSL